MPVVDVRKVRMVVLKGEMFMNKAVGVHTVPLKFVAMLVVNIMLVPMQ